MRLARSERQLAAREADLQKAEEQAREAAENEEVARIELEALRDNDPQPPEDENCQCLICFKIYDTVMERDECLHKHRMELLELRRMRQGEGAGNHPVGALPRQSPRQSLQTRRTSPRNDDASEDELTRPMPPPRAHDRPRRDSFDSMYDVTPQRSPAQSSSSGSRARRKRKRSSSTEDEVPPNTPPGRRRRVVVQIAIPFAGGTAPARPSVPAGRRATRSMKVTLNPGLR